MNCPELSGIPLEIVEYIDYLERQLESVSTSNSRRKPLHKIKEVQEEPVSESSWISEPPGRASVISITSSGVAKRSFRHLYNLQRRGGMGIFDIETNEDDPPASLTIAEPEQTLLLITNFGRAFRLPVQQI